MKPSCWMGRVIAIKKSVALTSRRLCEYRHGLDQSFHCFVERHRAFFDLHQPVNRSLNLQQSFASALLIGVEIINCQKRFFVCHILFPLSCMTGDSLVNFRGSAVSLPFTSGEPKLTILDSSPQATPPLLSQFRLARTPTFLLASPPTSHIDRDVSLEQRSSTSPVARKTLSENMGLFLC